MKRLAALAIFTALNVTCFAQAPKQAPASPSVPSAPIPPAPLPAMPSLTSVPSVNAAPTPGSKTGNMTVDLSGTRPAALQKGDGIQGFKLKDFPVNDLFQYLARQAGKQYFSNEKLTATVSGQMKDGDPIQRMQEVAFQYGITLYQKGDTIYAIPSDAIANLPKKQGEFVLRYLRPDTNRLKELIAPFLTQGSGSVDFEDKTNTVVVHDNDPAIARVADFLARVDQPQRQITIQVRIFRVNTDAANRVGVDWSQTLGERGLNLQATATTALQQVFGVNIARDILNEVLNSDVASQIADVGSSNGRTYTNNYNQSGSATTNVAIGPTAITAVLRALYGSANVEEESNPTIVTEDNETAVIENINKIPIVTTTVDTSSAGATTSSEVRYRIDPDEPFDIGVKITVKPTILPGNKVRLVVEPSVGSIKSFVQAASGDPALPNEYPDVILSRMKNIATIPNGYTLLFGGFSRVTTTKGGTKVPILGDIPGVNFFFKSREDSKIRENMVFMITATATDISRPEVITAETERIRRTYIETNEAYAADDSRVNLTPEPNLLGTIQDEFTPFAKANPNENAISPKNKKNAGLSEIKTPQQIQQESAAGAAPVVEPTPAPDRRKSRPWEFIVPARNPSTNQ